MTELFASCPAPGCSEWGPQVWTEAEKQAVQQRHQARYHPRSVEASVEAVTALVADDPMGQRERVAIEEAIRVVCRRDGRVSPNTVRPLLPSWVLPQRIGAIFAAMSRPGGELVKVARVPLDDTKSRNTHHDANEYALRDEMRQGVA